MSGWATKRYEFQMGETVSLDSVYSVIGMIPPECYHQDDPADTAFTGGDSGETITFKKDVELVIRLKVSP